MRGGRERYQSQAQDQSALKIRLRDLAQRRLRNQPWVASVEEAPATIAAWRVDDNTARPHDALGQQPPAAFARAWQPPVETAAG